MKNNYLLYVKILSIELQRILQSSKLTLELYTTITTQFIFDIKVENKSLGAKSEIYR